MVIYAWLISALSLYITFSFPTNRHQKYIGNHYAACLALFYKFANYQLCHSPCPPGALSLSATLHPLPSIDHHAEKSKLSEFLFFSTLMIPSWAAWLWNSSKDANLFLTSGVKIIKEYLETQEGGEDRCGRRAACAQSWSCGTFNNSFRSKIIIANCAEHIAWCTVDRSDHWTNELFSSSVSCIPPRVDSLHR